jgi:RNA polymerase sigma-70 factor, ECF subfamily
VEGRLREHLDRGEVDAAFDWLYRQLRADLDRFVRLRVRAADADDVGQEVWAAVRVALPRYRFESRPGVWLRAIARHKLADAYRRHETCDTLDSELAGGGVMGAALGLDPPTTPSSQLNRNQRGRALQQALARLEPIERELLALRFVDDLKPGEIAVVLGDAIAANTISQRIVRLCRRLRDELRELE